MKRFLQDLAWLCIGVLMARILDEETHAFFALAGIVLLGLVFIAAAGTEDDRRE